MDSMVAAGSFRLKESLDSPLMENDRVVGDENYRRRSKQDQGRS